MGFEKSDLVYMLNAVLAAENHARAEPPALKHASTLFPQANGFAASKNGLDGVEPSAAWMALYTELFNFRFEAVDVPSAGARFIPLAPGDALYKAGAARNYLLFQTTDLASFEHPNQAAPGSPYALHPSLLAILRAYELVAGTSAPTGALLSADDGGAPGWPVVHEQATRKLGLILQDEDATNAPLIATDAFGAYAPGPNERPQLVTAQGLVELDPSAPIEAGLALRSGQSLLAAMNALPVTAHNTAVAEIKTALVSIGSRDLLNGWLSDPVEQFPKATEAAASLAWDGARLFQTARYAAEMAAKTADYDIDAPPSAYASHEPGADARVADGHEDAHDQGQAFDLPFLAELARQAAAQEPDLVSDVAARDMTTPSPEAIAAEVVVVELASESQTAGEIDRDAEALEDGAAAPINDAPLPPQSDVEF